MNIKNIVKNLVEKHGTNDPFEIIEAENIICYFADLHPSVQGMFFRDFNEDIIFINSNLPDFKKRETAAHELGHRNMHKGINTYTCTDKTFVVKEKYEVQANAFSAEMIISDERYFSILNEYKGVDYKTIAAAENISPEILEIKRFRMENKCL